jgi:CRISPR-associated protein (TIGR02584 family)
MAQRPTEGQPRHILLCVAGLTPQIITETLYALTQQRHERIDEIRVITTLGGRNRILSALLDPQQGKFFVFCRDYSIDPSSIVFNETTIRLLHGPDGRTSPDIRSVEDNACAADQICEIVRKLTQEPHTRVHASAAGGRKTMSIYLTMAMQLFGRVYDQLSHVLVSEDFETHPDFFYIPPTPQELEVKRAGQVIKRISTADAEIHLADIPFIRLRGVRSAWLPSGEHSYSDFVQQAQADLDLLDSVHELRINTRNKSIIVANRTIKLTERELFVYALLAYLRQQSGRGEEGFVQLDEITMTDLDTVFRRITVAKGRERGLKDYQDVPRFAFLPTLEQQLASTIPQDREDVTRTFSEIVARIKRKCEAQRLPEDYLITTSGPRGALRYGLRMPPERITWDDQAPSATP